MQQPMQDLEDSSDPTTAINIAIALLAKAFKVNTKPTNNNGKGLLIPHNSQIAQPGINMSQDIKIQMVDDNVGNLVRHNAVQDDGNEVGQNAVQNMGLEAELGDLKGKSSDTQSASNTLDLLSQKLKDGNVSLEFQYVNGMKFRKNNQSANVLKSANQKKHKKLKGVLTLTPEEQLSADTMQALKESKKMNRRQPNTTGSRTSTKPGVLDEEKVTSKAKSNVTLDWGSEEESEYTKEDDDDENIEWMDTDEEEEKNDDDKSIDLEKTDDEETDDEFVHKMKKNKDADTGNGDEEITDAAKADAKKTEELKDDIKKAELPPISSSLSVSSGFSNQFLNLYSDTSLIGTIKDTTNAKINFLLDVQIQQEIPQIQSPSILTVPISVIFETLVLTPIPETPSVIPITTLLPPPIKYPQQVDYKEMTEESMQANIINEVKNQLPKFLPKAVFDFATMVIQSTTILFDKIDKSRSYLTHDKHQVLFDALLNLIILDDAVARGQADPEKVMRKRDRDDEDPLAGLNQEELVFEMASYDIEQSVDDVSNDTDQPLDDSTQTKDKDPKKDWFKHPSRPHTPNQE
nr:hypothetical protein [Tanacetum cinerariifolium]